MDAIAVSARYDWEAERIVVVLKDGERLELVPAECQGLERAKPHELSDIEISPSGRGLHFPLLDADLYVPALVEGAFGSKAWSKRSKKQGG